MKYKNLLIVSLIIFASSGCALSTTKPVDGAQPSYLEPLKTSMRLVTYGVLYKNRDFTGDIITVTDNAISLIESGELTSGDALEQYLLGLARGHKDEVLAIFMIAEGKRLLNEVISQYRISSPSDIRALMITLVKEVNTTATLFVPKKTESISYKKLKDASREAARRTDLLLTGKAE